MAEFLDIVDEYGNPTGEIVDREKAHTEGIRHRTSHVWILRHGADGVEVLLQKRSQNKDSFPGCYDISSAGHIPAGIEWKESALRELEEELGIDWICEEDLLLCGQRKITHDDEFHGKPFVDRQLSNIYCLWLDVEPSKLRLQEEEVESVVWMNLADCKHRIATEDPSFQHAIVLEELEMLPRV